MTKHIHQISKFLSLVLRHKPETIGVQLDESGWVNVDVLLEKTNAYGIRINLEMLKQIVETNAKKRFAFNESMDRIRASQGHSVAVELGYINQKPPEILFHGTAEKNVESILKTGIVNGTRQHVHLSADMETATKVGQRHGKPVIFIVSAVEMFNDDHVFFFSENGVWLTNFVPVEYLKINDTK